MHGRWTAAAAMWCHCVAAAAIFKNVLRQIRIFMNNLFILLFSTTSMNMNNIAKLYI